MRHVRVHRCIDSDGSGETSLPNLDNAFLEHGRDHQTVDDRVIAMVVAANQIPTRQRPPMLDQALHKPVNSILLGLALGATTPSSRSKIAN